MLPRHGRHGYHPWRGHPQRACAGGAWLAAYLGVNLEHFASGEGLGAELAPGAPQPEVLNHAWRDHGNRVGAWRLIETLDELSLPCAVLLNSATYGHAPELVVAHGAGRPNGRAWTDEFGAPIVPAGGRGARVKPRIDGGRGGAEGQGTAPLALPLHRREPCHPALPTEAEYRTR